jgi:sugar phosphate permease
MTFVLEGLPSVLWAGLWLFLVKDKPSQSPWMDPASVDHLDRQIALEQQSLPKIGSVREALLSPTVLLLCVQYFAWSVGLYGVVLWLPTIIRAGASIGIEKTGLLSAVPYLLAIFMMLVISGSADRTQRRRAHIWPCLVFSGLAMLGSYLLAAQNFYFAYFCLILAGGAMYAPYGPFFAMIPEIVPKNVAAETFAAVNSCGALGAFVGSWVVGLLQARTGNSRAGFLLMAVSLIISGILILFIKDAPRVTTDVRQDLPTGNPDLRDAAKL